MSFDVNVVKTLIANNDVSMVTNFVRQTIPAADGGDGGSGSGGGGGGTTTYKYTLSIELIPRFPAPLASIVDILTPELESGMT